jgi:hypothetical protein
MMEKKNENKHRNLGHRVARPASASLAPTDGRINEDKSDKAPSHLHRALWEALCRL